MANAAVRHPVLNIRAVINVSKSDMAKPTPYFTVLVLLYIKYK